MGARKRDLREPLATDCNEISQLRKALTRATSALRSAIIQRDALRDTLTKIRGERLH